MFKLIENYPDIYKYIFSLFLVVFAFWLPFWGEKVEVFKVKRMDSLEGVTVTGVVLPILINHITPEVTAVVVEVLVEENDFVKKGQPLVKLQASAPKAALESQKGELKSAKANLKDLETEPRIQEIDVAAAEIKFHKAVIQKLLEDMKRLEIILRDLLSQELRLKKLYESGAVSFREYEQAKFARMTSQKEIDALKLELQQHQNRLKQSEYNYDLLVEGPKKEEFEIAKSEIKAQEGALKVAKSNLDKYTLVAPIDGYIYEIVTDPGGVASPAKPVIDMGSTKLHVEADIDEDQLDKVEVSQDAYILFDAYPERTFKSKVVNKINAIDNKTGTFIAWIEMPDLGGRPFAKGMTVDVTIITNKEKDALVIPSQFVFNEGGQDYVYSKFGLWAIRKKIKGKRYNNGRYIVQKGLRVRDIVIKPLANVKLHNFQKIKVKKISKY